MVVVNDHRATPDAPPILSNRDPAPAGPPRIREITCDRHFGRLEQAESPCSIVPGAVGQGLRERALDPRHCACTVMERKPLEICREESNEGVAHSVNRIGSMPTGESFLLTPQQLAKRLQVSVAWVRDHSTRKHPRLPVVRVGGLLRFRLEDIDRWIEQQYRRSASRVS